KSHKIISIDLSGMRFIPSKQSSLYILFNSITVPFQAVCRLGVFFTFIFFFLLFVLIAILFMFVFFFYLFFFSSIFFFLFYFFSIFLFICIAASVPLISCIASIISPLLICLTSCVVYVIYFVLLICYTYIIILWHIFVNGFAEVY